jgi:hypothetical protein
VSSQSNVTAETSYTIREMHFDTADVPAGEREALVGDILCNGLVPLQIEHLGHESQGIEVRLSSTSLGTLNLQSLRSTATAFKRTSRLVQHGSPPTVVLAVHRTGTTAVFQEGRKAVLGAGDLSRRRRPTTHRRGKQQSLDDKSGSDDARGDEDDDVPVGERLAGGESRRYRQGHGKGDRTSEASHGVHHAGPIAHVALRCVGSLSTSRAV